jgi:hypothetical protein
MSVSIPLTLLPFGAGIILGAAATFAWASSRPVEVETTHSGSVLAEVESHGAKLEALNSKVLALQKMLSSLANAPSASGDSLREDIVRAVRGELQALNLPGKEPQQDQRPPSPQSLESLRQAKSLVATATSARQWTESDAVQFRQLLANIEGDAQEDVILQLSGAINNGQLKVLTRGMPY